MERSILISTQQAHSTTRQPLTPPLAAASMASSGSLTAAPLWKVIFAALVLFGPLVFADSWHALCYFPNGDVSPDDTPCSASGGACCPKDWDCLSNGMCFSGDRHHERHSCTDQSWLDERCPWMCATGESFLQASYHEMSCLTKNRRLRLQKRRHQALH